MEVSERAHEFAFAEIGFHFESTAVENHYKRI